MELEFVGRGLVQSIMLRFLRYQEYMFHLVCCFMRSKAVVKGLKPVQGYFCSTWTIYDTVVRRCQHLISKFQGQLPANVYLIFTSQVLGSSGRFLVVLMMLHTPPRGAQRVLVQRSSRRFLLPVGKNGLELLEHEFYYLALEHHVDRHVR